MQLSPLKAALLIILVYGSSPIAASFFRSFSFLFSNSKKKSESKHKSENKTDMLQDIDHLRWGLLRWVHLRGLKLDECILRCNLYIALYINYKENIIWTLPCFNNKYNISSKVTCSNKFVKQGIGKAFRGVCVHKYCTLPNYIDIINDKSQSALARDKMGQCCKSWDTLSLFYCG